MANGFTYMEQREREKKWVRKSAFEKALCKLRTMVDLSGEVTFAIHSTFENEHTIQYVIITPGGTEILRVDLDPIASKHICNLHNGK